MVGFSHDIHSQSRGTAVFQRFEACSTLVGAGESLYHAPIAQTVSPFSSSVCGQLSCVPGSQTLEGSCTLQQCIRLSQECKQPLVVAKLDIQSAFDHLQHLAVSHFFQLLGQHKASKTLTKLGKALGYENALVVEEVTFTRLGVL